MRLASLPLRTCSTGTHFTASSPRRRVASMVASHAAQQHDGAAQPSRNSLSVAVIGGGAAGLVAARELAREGHRPVVYERSDRIGGVWAYDEATEDDPLCRNPGRRRVHGSMYAGLRTNLPRQLMGFTDYPFDGQFPGSQDLRQFCSHEEVQRYLEAFATHFDLLRFVRFNTEVVSVLPEQQTRQPPSPSAAAAAQAAAQAERRRSIDATSWPRWRVSLRPAGGSSNGTGSTGSSSSNGMQGEPSRGGGSRGRASCSAAEQRHEQQQQQTVQHDAVVVCNGHYSEPRLPDFPGQDAFPGQVVHSHNYRRPEPYAGQVVVVVGAASSGVDISQEIAEVAGKVYLCARAWDNPLTGEPLKYENAPKGSKVASVAANAVARAANVAELRADGSVLLVDGTVIPRVDTMLYCTGYVYSFPFLQELGEVSVQDNCVGPLYQHVFPPTLAPTLSFVGLPFNIVPFPQFELQSKWIARVLSGRVCLPPQSSMWKQTEAFYEQLALAGIARQYVHRQLGPIQWAYNQWLIEQCGPDVPAWPAWRPVLYSATGASRTANFDLYRDVPLSSVTPEAAEAEEAAVQEAAAVRKQQQQQQRPAGLAVRL